MSIPDKIANGVAQLATDLGANLLYAKVEVEVLGDQYCVEIKSAPHALKPDNGAVRKAIEPPNRRTR